MRTSLIVIENDSLLFSKTMNRLEIKNISNGIRLSSLLKIISDERRREENLYLLLEEL